MEEFMRYFIILLILCINSNSFAHFSLKQHEIIHYYPSIEKEYLDSKCDISTLKQLNCSKEKKDNKTNSTKQ